MRKLINIWKTPWNSHWMQRAIHILSLVRRVQLCMWFPREGTGGDGTGTVPTLTTVPSPGECSRLSRDAGSQLAFSQLHFIFGFACCFGQPSSERRKNRPCCTWYQWSTLRAVLGLVLFKVLEEEREDTAQPYRQPQTGRGCGSGSRAGGLRGTWWNSTRTNGKGCPFQGQPQQLLCRNPSSESLLLWWTVLQEMQLLPASTASSQQHKSDKKVTAEIRMDFSSPI